jgi:site-specific DNA-methyltransferase (adenine-specific)
MPERLLARIIEACSNEGDLVLDPFAGSGTTLAVAKKLRRRFLGFELSAEYVRQIMKRLGSIRPGDPLEGAAEPLQSVPSTSDGRRLDQLKTTRRAR